MSGEFGMSMSGPWSPPPGSMQASRRAPRRRLFGLLGVALASLCLLAWLATPAEAATDTLFAAPAAAGTGDCSFPANACTIATAVTKANALPVTDNVRIVLAGGIYLLSSPSPTALSVTFAGPSLTFEAGGGVPILSGTNTVRMLSVGSTSHVTLDGLEFEFGTTTGLGGAIENAGTLTVKNSTFTSNSAGNGGALDNMATGTLRVEGSTFSHNSSTGVGGGALINFGSATVVRSTINNNNAPINGGGINNQPGGNLTLVASTLAGNTSAGQGGAMSTIGTIKVEASTIVGNIGSTGSVIATSDPTTATFADDLIGSQSSGTACTPANDAFVDGGFNLEVDGTCISTTTPAAGSHNGLAPYGSSTYGAVLDAYLADGLANNGGPTQTVALSSSATPPTPLSDPAFAVVPASFQLPAPLDGLSAACSLPDQRGVARTSPCDVGAFELPPTPPPPPPSSSTPSPKPVAVAQGKPSLTALKLAPKKLRDGQKATISFQLDVAAKVTFQLQRKVRKHGKAKLVSTSGGPKSFSAAAGPVKRTWTPHGLRAGSYQLRATPAGGAVEKFAFKIVTSKGR